MAQNKQLTWSELRVGLFVLAATALLVVVIFYVTSAGGGFGPKYRLYVLLPEVEGLTVGAPVRLDGVEVGNVEKIAVALPKPGHISDDDLFNWLLIIQWQALGFDTWILDLRNLFHNVHKKKTSFESFPLPRRIHPDDPSSFFSKN